LIDSDRIARREDADVRDALLLIRAVTIAAFGHIGQDVEIKALARFVFDDAERVFGHAFLQKARFRVEIERNRAETTDRDTFAAADTFFAHDERFRVAFDQRVGRTPLQTFFAENAGLRLDLRRDCRMLPHFPHPTRQAHP